MYDLIKYSIRFLKIWIVDIIILYEQLKKKNSL